MSGAAPEGAEEKKLTNTGWLGADFDEIEALLADGADKKPVMARESVVHEKDGAADSAGAKTNLGKADGAAADKSSAASTGAKVSLEDLLSGRVRITKEMAKDGGCQQAIISEALALEASELQAKVMLAIMYQFQGVAQQTDHGDRVDQVAGELAKAQNLLDAKNAELEEIKRKHQELVTAFSGSTLSAGQEAQTFELSPTTGRLTMAGDASYDTPFKLANAGVDDESKIGETTPGVGGKAKAIDNKDQLMKFAREGRKSVMTAADKVAFEKNAEVLAEVLSGLGGSSSGGTVMPQVLTPGEMQKIAEKVRKKAEEKCSTKMAAYLTSEAKILEHVLKILEEANVDMPILQRALRAESYEEFVQEYKDGYSRIDEASLSAAQLAKLSFEQYMDAAISQNDKVLIIVVEAGLSKISQALAARCNPSAQNRSVASGGSKERLSDTKQRVGAGLVYMLEATMHLCRSSWDTVLRDFLDVMDCAHVLEEVCNGSIERMMLELDRIFSWFERKNGPIDGAMMKGMSTLIILDKIKVNKSSHLAESLDKGLRDHKYDPTQRDLKSALVEAGKAIELLTVDEKMHHNPVVRSKVELDLRNLRKALDKYRGAKIEMANNAQDGNIAQMEYHRGLVTGAGTLLLGKNDLEKTLTVSHEESKKRLADETQQIGQMLSRVLDVVTKFESGKIDPKDATKLSELTSQLKSFKEQVIDGNSRAQRRGRSTERRSNQRGKSGERGQASRRSSERKEPAETDCIFWKQGSCKKGSECPFKHAGQPGSDPTADWPWRAKRGKSSERDQQADNDTDRPDCKNPECTGKAHFNKRTGGWYDFCRWTCKEDFEKQSGGVALNASAEPTPAGEGPDPYATALAAISFETGIQFAQDATRRTWRSTTSTIRQF